MTTVAERTWVLDSGAGWRESVPLTLDDRDGALMLSPLPGKARRIEDPADAAQAQCWPAALGGHPSKGLFIVDAGADDVRRVTLERPTASRVVRAAVLPTLGGRGRGHRQMHQPQGIAILPGGAIAVADTGNHRVQLFSPPPYALLHLWGGTDALGQPAPGDGPLEFRDPCALAVDSDGTLYVADRGNGRVQRIRRDGSALDAVGAGVLREPAKVAVGPDGAIAVVDRAQACVWIFSTRRTFPFALPGLAAPISVAFAPDGRLYVGDAGGRIHLFTQTSRATEPFQLAGSGVTGLDGTIEDLWWWPESSPRLVALSLDDAPGERPRLWAVDPDGGRALADVFMAGPLDSAIERCQWHRIRMDATVPTGGSIRIESFTAETIAAVVPPPTSPEFASWKPCLIAGDDAPDGLVQSDPGRYLWMKISLRSNGQSSPAIRRIRISYPRSSYLQYLPAVFQEDDESRRFLERFLGVFKSGFDDFDETIDQLHELFDPRLTPAAYLPWLASWVALVRDPQWPEAHLRDQIAGAVARYRRRGTPDGLREALRGYAGTEARILEHFRLRRWVGPNDDAAGVDLGGGTPVWSRDVYQRLQLTSYSQIGRFRLTGRPEPAIEPYEWGSHRFSVFFLASPYSVDDTRKRVSDVLSQEAPAHTEASLCPVFPRFRVGVQARVGVDTVVGTVSHLVLNQLATLGYDTILSGSREEHTLRALGSGVRPVVGSTTRVP